MAVMGQEKEIRDPFDWIWKALFTSGGASSKRESRDEIVSGEQPAVLTQSENSRWDRGSVENAAMKKPAPSTKPCHCPGVRLLTWEGSRNRSVLCCQRPISASSEEEVSASSRHPPFTRTRSDSERKVAGEEK